MLDPITGKEVTFPKEKTFHASLEYLLSRGINTDTIEANGIHIATGDDCYAAIKCRSGTNYKQGFIIPYYPNDPDEWYCQVVMTGERVPNGFTGTLKPEKDDPSKRVPAGPVHVYVPPMVETRPFDGDMYLCESPIKALALAQQGYYAIGGNGVDSIFTTKGASKNFPAGLFHGEQVKRVFILFDSDYVDNDKVKGSIKRQCLGLRAEFGREFEIWHKQLDHGPDGKKWGIDDAVAERGIEWLRHWLASDEDKVMISVDELAQHLYELNDGYVVCSDPVGIIKLRNKKILTKSQFTDMEEADRTFPDRLKPSVKIYPAKEWLEWEDRAKVDKLSYRPGEAALGTDGELTTFNTWTDTGCEPKAGDPATYVECYDNAIPDAQVRELLHCCFAHIVQNKTIRLEKILFMVGIQGSGKSLLALKIMRKILGRNHLSASVEDFTSSFNAPFMNRELICADDVDAFPKAAMGRLRRMITDEYILVNQKNVPQFEMENRAVWCATSNYWDSLPIQDNERRALVVEFDPKVYHPDGSAHWNEVFQWLEGGGYGIVRGWYENYDLSNWSPYFVPPMTEAKYRVQDANKNAEQEFVEDLWADPSSIIGSSKRCCFSAPELWCLMTGEPMTQYSQGRGAKLSAALKASNFKQYMEDGKPKQIRAVSGGKAERWWIIQGIGQFKSVTAVKDDVRLHTFATGTHSGEKAPGDKY